MAPRVSVKTFPRPYMLEGEVQDCRARLRSTSIGKVPTTIHDQASVGVPCRYSRQYRRIHTAKVHGRFISL